MRKAVSVLVLSVLLLTTAGACPAPEPAQVEDCDAEDFRNREDDCGFTDADRRKSPAPAKTARQPAPKVSTKSTKR